MKDIRQTWKLASDKKELTSSDMAALAIIKAIAKDGGTLESTTYFLRKAFTPITNKNKLANGQHRWDAAARATSGAKYRGSYFLSAAAENDEELAMMIKISSDFKWGGL